ncbi:hypothetical protein [Actinokineospora sp. NPDC004072]
MGVSAAQTRQLGPLPHSALAAATLCVLQGAVPLAITAWLDKTPDGLWTTFTRRFDFWTSWPWWAGILGYALVLAATLPTLARRRSGGLVLLGVVSAISYAGLAGFWIGLQSPGSIVGHIGETLSLSVVYGNFWPALLIAIFTGWRYRAYTSRDREGRAHGTGAAGGGTSR